MTDNNGVIPMEIGTAFVFLDFFSVDCDKTVKIAKIRTRKNLVPHGIYGT